jgi:hypothetical protein
MSQALDDVAAERERQKTIEGFTEAHDDAHAKGEMAAAAACYAFQSVRRYVAPAPFDWPWEVQSWKPKDRRRNLVLAGALIIAEIERLDRASPPAPAKRLDDGTEEQADGK